MSKNDSSDKPSTPQQPQPKQPEQPQMLLGPPPTEQPDFPRIQADPDLMNTVISSGGPEKRSEIEHRSRQDRDV